MGKPRAGDKPLDMIALLLWKDRYRNPEMAVQITDKDVSEWQQCTEYLGVTPKVLIHRPGGKLVVQVVDERGNSIVPIESTGEGADARDHSAALRAARNKAGELAARLRNDFTSGAFSLSTLNEAADTLLILANG